jgi:hypothetical protein
MNYQIKSKRSFINIFYRKPAENEEADIFALTFSQWLWKEKIKLGFLASFLTFLGYIFNFAKIDLGYVFRNVSLASLTLKELSIISLTVQFLFIIIVLVLFLRDKYVRFNVPKSDIAELAFDEEIKKANDEKKIWQRLELTHKNQKKESGFQTIIPANWVQFKKEVNVGIEQFFNAWLACWFGWALLYLILLIANTHDESSNSFVHFLDEQKASFITFFNNFSSLMILIMFLTLNIKTAKGKFLKIFSFIGTFLIVVLALISGYTKEYSTLSFLFALLSGFFASISMALFFGSLNSFFTRIPIIIIICLHFYAALQILFIFESNTLINFLGGFVTDPEQRSFLEKTIKSPIGTVMMCAYALAFLAKILLFLTVRWILQTARLTLSMVNRKSAYNANENDALLWEISNPKTLKQVTILD